MNARAKGLHNRIHREPARGNMSRLFDLMAINASYGRNKGGAARTIRRVEVVRFLFSKEDRYFAC
jgi:hypothetical protein